MKRALLVVLAMCTALVVGVLAYVDQAKVPAEAIQRSVLRDATLLEAAMRLPVARRYQANFLWQSNPSLCGAASIANVFRSLQLEPTTESGVLDGTGKCFFGICPVGLTLDELRDIAASHSGRNVTVLRDLSEAEFTAHLRYANDPQRRYIVNFDRKAIFGAGAGHHSPIGGYVENGDLVLVLDVNREFGFWLVPRKRLFMAMDTLDGDRKRGLLLVR